jgi:hypothetical protein
VLKIEGIRSKYLETNRGGTVDLQALLALSIYYRGGLVGFTTVKKTLKRLIRCLDSLMLTR